MMAMRDAHVSWIAGLQARSHCLSQRLLKPASRIGIGDNFGSRFRELHGSRVQPPEPAIAASGGVTLSVPRGGDRS